MKEKLVFSKALIAGTVLAVFLTGCNGQVPSSSESMTETGAQTVTSTGTEKPAETVTSSAGSTAQFPEGDKIIHTAVKLDTAGFKEVGPLIGEKALTFKDVGEPYFTAVYYSGMDGRILTNEIGAQEIGLLDCLTGKKTVVAQVEPMVRLETYALTESPYAAVVYTKRPADLADTLSPEEYQALIAQTDTTLLWIDTRTGKSTEYTFRPAHVPDFSTQQVDRFYGMELIKNDTLLLYYYAYNQDEGALSQSFWCLEKLSLSTGETADLSAAFQKSSAPYMEGTEESFVFSSDGERLYQRYSRWRRGQNVYGFRVLDENLNVLQDVEVLKSPLRYDLNTYRDIQDVRVQLLWTGQETDESAGKSHQYFLYRPKDGRYVQEPYDWEKAQIGNMYPGNDSSLPYFIKAEQNRWNVPVLRLLGNGTDLDGMELVLDIPEFKDMFYFYSTRSNYAGGTLICTIPDKDAEGEREHWYVLREELIRALGTGG